MSSPTDYSKLKVTELRDALQKRNLSITGVKAELIARLTSADATTDAPSPAANKTHLPTADDYEVDWDDNDDPAPATTTTAAPTTAPVAATPAESAPKPAESATPAKTATEEKPKKKFASIAALFETPATAATTTPAAKTPTKPVKDAQNSQSPSSPSTVTDEANTSTATTSAPAKPEPSFAAGLEASSLDVELERRKARAKRFGMDEDTTTNEATKKLEREKRFGNATTEDVPEKKEVVKGLDSALPEHRRERKRGPPAQAEGGRGGKRSRGGNNNGNNNGSGAGRGGDRDRRPQVPRRATGGIQKPSSQKSGGYKAILDDPTEKAKAEARARKFGVAQ